jgi:diguanylate cyclase (GGDEF)-like protein
VAWSVPESSLSLADADRILSSLGLAVHPLAMAEPFATDANLVVLHSASFSDLDHLRRAYEQLSRPSLIVVNSRDEENRVLKWPKLPLTVDVCQADALRDQVAERLKRLLGAASRQSGWLAEINADQGLGKQIYDQSYLNVRLAREFANARKHCRSLTLVWLELGDLGRINTTYGNAAGDRVLKAFASTVLANIRVVDWLAYHGKGEFCLAMPDTWLAEGRQVAERIRKDIASVTVRVDDRHTLTPKVNLGTAEMTDRDESFEDLIQKASEAALMQKIPV